MSDDQAIIEGLKALAQLGISAVFIWAWYRERLINVDVVNTYMKLRESALEIEKERIKLEYEQLIRADKQDRVLSRAHLVKTDIPNTEKN